MPFLACWRLPIHNFVVFYRLHQVKVYRDAAGPRVLRQLTESVQIGVDTGEWSADAKQANEKLVEDFRVSRSLV